MLRFVSVAPALLVVAATALPTVAAGQNVGGARAERTVEHRVDDVFRDVDGPTLPGCALSVMRDGAPIYERGYGMANLEYGIPITPHSVFHVASVSKHFTAMAVELLVGEGRVSWDDDIRTYVPQVPDFGTVITLRHLVHHTSGIRDQWNLLAMAGWRWEGDVVTQKDVLDITSRQTALNFPPGERYLYSNTGFTLLAVVVERVTGQTIREFTTERIFEPLGMEATHFHDDHEMIVRNRAWAYAPELEGDFGLKNSIPDFDVVGATSLFTTAHELAAWDRNFYTGRVGGEDALERLRERFALNSGDTIAYAHGLSVGSYRGLRTEGHGGADAGYRSQFLRFPDQRFTVAVLCNFPSANPGRRAQLVAEAYLDDAMTPEIAASSAGADGPTVALSGAELSALEGHYRGELPSEVVSVGLDGDTLRLGPGSPLRPLGDGRFEVMDRGELVIFESVTDGATVLMTPSGVYERLPKWEPDERELDAYVGLFRSDELGAEYGTTMEDGELRLHHRKLDSRTMRPLARDVFAAGGRIVDFTRGVSGRIDGFHLSDGRVWNVRFDRIDSNGGVGR